jgi:hypothetical protein
MGSWGQGKGSARRRRDSAPKVRRKGPRPCPQPRGGSARPLRPGRWHGAGRQAASAPSLVLYRLLVLFQGRRRDKWRRKGSLIYTSGVHLSENGPATTAPAWLSHTCMCACTHASANI